ncbi:RUS family member 1 [Aplysia californica]|uniref:RUS family member 1 n=1 Tax=Aplysia californica TaxID=6500 RepID=A0ABM1AAU1_APLCA|nr:RUS family member 1 [Aplysia californica]
MDFHENKAEGDDHTRLVCQEQYGSAQRKNNFVLDETDQKLHKVDKSANYSSVKQVFSNIFLPQGYPDSVSDDYLTYQIWDTVQAFASSITGTLAAYAVLKGVGVGDETATVLGATMTWLLKDGAGMMGRILFAWMKGTGLDCDAKRWRLFADFLNDLAFFLDILAPTFGNYFTFVVCVSGVFRSIVGVAGGATRAALTQHQARRNNMADVSAKDGSQETLVNLIALLCNLVLVPLVSGQQYLVWPLYVVFTFLHIFANYKAVAAVRMETINQTRLYFITRWYLEKEEVLDVKTVNQLEPVIFPIRRTMNINLGVSFSEITQSGVSFAVLRDVYERSMTEYILGVDFKRREINIVLSQSSDTLDQLQACFHAELINFIVEKVQKGEELTSKLQKLGKLVEESLHSESENQALFQSILSTSLLYTEGYMNAWTRGLHTQGWVTETALLAADEWRALWDFEYLEDKKHG